MPLVNRLLAFICVVICLVFIHATYEDAVFPSISQQRMIERMLGPAGLAQYRWKDQISRVLSDDDVSSVLMQKNPHYVAPWRTQFLLSQQRRSHMITRLFHHGKSLLTPFILPSMRHAVTNFQGEFELSSTQQAVLSVLQTLQEPYRVMLQQTYQKQNPLKLAPVPAKLLASGDTNLDTNELLYRHHVQQHKSWLKDLFDVKFSNLQTLASDLGSTSPLMPLDTLHQYATELLPILLLDIPQHAENALLSILQRNAVLSDMSRDEFNAIVASLRQSQVPNNSHGALSDALHNIGSTVFVENEAQFNFWVSLLTIQDTHVIYYDQQQTDNNGHVHATITSKLLSSSHLPEAFRWDAWMLPVTADGKLHVEFVYHDPSTVLSDNDMAFPQTNLAVKHKFITSILNAYQQFLTSSPQSLQSFSVHQYLHADSIPSITTVASFAQKFFSASTQDELLAAEVDIEGLVDMSLLHTLTTTYISRIHQHFADDLIATTAQLKSKHLILQDATQLTHFHSFITTIIAPQIQIATPQHMVIQFPRFTASIAQQHIAMKSTTDARYNLQVEKDILLDVIKRETLLNDNLWSLQSSSSNCDACKTVYQQKNQEMRQTLPDQLQNMFEPICQHWYQLVSLFTKISVPMCDPTQPIECYNFCMGMVTVFKTDVAAVLAFTQTDPERQCFKLQQCDYNPDDHCPILPQQLLIPNPGDATLRRTLFHITDVHYDHNYDTKATIPCKLPICCELDATVHETMGTTPLDDGTGFVMTETELVSSSNPSFELSDDNYTHPRAYGEFICDAPHILVESAFAQVALHCPDILVFTGDAPAHDLWRQTQGANVQAIRTVTEMMIKNANACVTKFLEPTERQALFGTSPYYQDIHERMNVIYQSLTSEEKEIIDKEMEARKISFQHDIAMAAQQQQDDDDDAQEKQKQEKYSYLSPRRRLSAGVPLVYPTLGNHAAAPVNHYAGIQEYDSWLLTPLADIWDWLTYESRDAVRYGGFYVEPATTNVFVIGLHTGLYDENNPWRLLNLGYWDSEGQMTWLEQILSTINQMGSRALLVMHEATGSVTTVPKISQVWLDLYKKYHNVIINILAGHEHHDITRLIHQEFPQAAFIPQTTAQHALHDPYSAFHSTILSSRGTTQQLSSTLHYKMNTNINLHQISRHSQSYLPLIETKLVHLGLRPQQHISRVLAPFRPQALQQLEPILLELLPSSITPNKFATNPAFRVYQFTNYVLVDFNQYLFNLSHQPTPEQPVPQWNLRYSGHEWGIAAITAQEWQNMVLTQQNNQDVWDLYTTRYWGYVPLNISPRQKKRFTADESICWAYTHTDPQIKYCMKNWTSGADPTPDPE